MVGLFAKILGELQPINKLSIRMPFHQWSIGIDGFFGVGFGETGEEGDWHFVFEFFVDEVDDFLGDGWLAGFGFAGSGSGFSH